MSGAQCCQNLNDDYEAAITDAYNDRQYLQTALSNALAIPDYDLAESHAQAIVEQDQAIAILEAEQSGASSGCGCWS